MFQENQQNQVPSSEIPNPIEPQKSLETPKGFNFNNFKMDKNSILIGIAVLAVIVTSVLIFTNSGSNNILSFISGSSKDALAKKAVDYLNQNILKGQVAELGGVFEESGVIKMQIKVNGSDFESYVTKDGKLFFPEAINISSYSNNSQGNGNGSAVDFDITQENHVRGDFSAPITLVEFSDFECPFCEKHVPTLERILEEYAGSVRLVYRHFPLKSIHPSAQKAAEASECASEQGKFWEYHDLLFDNQKSGFSVEKFKQWAVQLGLNASQFDNCLDSSKYAGKVDADASEGASKRVNGTPATFINGELVSGAVPYEDFKKKIDALLSE